MNDINLDYLKDTEGNYIVKTKQKDEDWQGEVIATSGQYSENLIVSTKFLERKLKHKIEDIVKNIEKDIITGQRVSYDDILYERFILQTELEDELNPLFQRMSSEEIEEYTKDSKKVRVHITFEIHIKQQKHLWLKSHLGLLKKKFQNNN